MLQIFFFWFVCLKFESCVLTKYKSQVHNYKHDQCHVNNEALKLATDLISGILPLDKKFAILDSSASKIQLINLLCSSDCCYNFYILHAIALVFTNDSLILVIDSVIKIL